jgi:predicted histidine transporter YuiF (NhaC family)
MNIIIAFASMLLGGLLGFCLPFQTEQKYKPHEDYDRSTKYMPNTNLEDVSDWLTKIIIGVTLTQLGMDTRYLQSMADYLIDNSNLMLQVDSARPLLIALIIYSFVAGFIIGYSYTRIYLPNLFSIMEENRKQKAEIALWKEEVRKKEEQLCNHPNSEDKPS